MNDDDDYEKFMNFRSPPTWLGALKGIVALLVFVLALTTIMSLIG